MSQTQIDFQPYSRQQFIFVNSYKHTSGVGKQVPKASSNKGSSLTVVSKSV